MEINCKKHNTPLRKHRHRKGYILACLKCNAERLRLIKLRYGGAAKYRNLDKEKFPEKYRARKAVENALKAGKLVKFPCQECGEIKVQGHHPNYEEPLKVLWLCALHHKDLHRK